MQTFISPTTTKTKTTEKWVMKNKVNGQSSSRAAEWQQKSLQQRNKHQRKFVCLAVSPCFCCCLCCCVVFVDFFASSLFRLTHSPIFCACACADASSSTSTSSDSSSCTGRCSSVGVGIGVAVGSVVVDGDCVRCILSLTLETSLNLALIFRCFIFFPPLFVLRSFL